MRRNCTGARRNARRSELPSASKKAGRPSRLEAERGQALAGHRQVAGEHAAEPDLAVLGDQPLEDHLEPVAGLDVAGEVHLPGVDVGEVPGQPLPVGAVELVVGDLRVERLVERVVDRALDPDLLRPPGDRLDHGLPAVGAAVEDDPLLRDWCARMIRLGSVSRRLPAEAETSPSAAAGGRAASAGSRPVRSRSGDACGGRRDRTASRRAAGCRAISVAAGATAARATAAAGAGCGQPPPRPPSGRGEDGGGRRTTADGQQPRRTSPHQSICRRMKVGISISGTSVRAGGAAGPG